jgi:hypothetical protein
MDNVGNFSKSSVGGAAVNAIATGATSMGVFATSSEGPGIVGISTLAGAGGVDVAPKPGGSGVTGENGKPNGFGVTGTAVGQGGIGVQGNAQDGTAVQGIATTGTGVSAISATGTALSVGSAGLFDSPQVSILQETPNDYARIRLSAQGDGQPWDIAAGGPGGVLNFYSNATATNVISATSNGNVTIAGSLKQHSSRTLKEDIRDLTYADALNAFSTLSPVRYKFRSDSTHSEHLGFIAEDLPELIAAGDRKTVCQMDIVAILTTVVHQLRADNLDLRRRIEHLEAS